MLTTKQASEIAGVNIDTIRRWEKLGKIKCYRTEGGHRRYDLDSLYKYMGKKDDTKIDKVTLIYARVSSRQREEDLNRQLQVLELYCASKGWKYKTLTDIGSGLNYKKKGLIELIKLIETNQIERLVINYEDTIATLGSELIYEMCKWHDVEIEVVCKDYSPYYKDDLSNLKV